MSTVVTRALKLTDRKDKLAVRVSPETYKDKYGVLQVSLTDISWTSGTNVTVDAGKVNIFPANDPERTILEDHAMAATVGTHSIDKDFIFAVNLGEPDVSVLKNPDGSWDLVHLTVELPEDNAISDPITLTLTYTVTWTDLSATAGVTNKTVTLKVTNQRVTETGYTSIPMEDVADKNGYVLVTLQSLAVTVIDNPPNAADLPNDLVPLFTLKRGTEIVSQHPTPKVSGTRTYSNRRYVFAINNGEGDASTSILRSSDGDILLLSATLEKLRQWPCNDHVEVVLSHTSDFTEIA